MADNTLEAFGVTRAQMEEANQRAADQMLPMPYDIPGEESPVQENRFGDTAEWAARDAWKEAKRRFQVRGTDEGAAGVFPEADSGVLNTFTTGLGYAADMGLAGLEASDAAWKYSVGLASELIPGMDRNQERRFTRDVSSVPEAFAGNVFGINSGVPLPTASQASTGVRMATGDVLDAMPEYDPNRVNIFGGMGARDPGYTRGGSQELPESTGFDQQYRFEIDDSESVVIPDNLKLFDGSLSSTTNLSEVADVLIHEDLFYQYPQLASMKIGIDESLAGTNTRGYFQPGENYIGINPNIAADPRALRSTLIHELQHYIQVIEGFSKGTNPNDPELKPISAQLYWEHQNKIDEYQKQLDELVDPESVIGTLGEAAQVGLDVLESFGVDPISVIENPGSLRQNYSVPYRIKGPYSSLISSIEKAQEQMSPSFGGRPSSSDLLRETQGELDNFVRALATETDPSLDLGSFQGLVDSYRAVYDKYGVGSQLYSLPLDQFKSAKKELETALNNALSLPERPESFFDAAYEAYRKKGGEAEARNVQARIDFDLERRFRESAESTEDVPRSDQWGIPSGFAESRLDNTSSRVNQQSEVSPQDLDYNSRVRTRRGLLDRDTIAGADNILYRPDRGYRFIGSGGYADLMDNGIIRAAQGTKKDYGEPYFMTGKSSSRYGQGESGDYMVETPQNPEWNFDTSGAYARPNRQLTLNDPIRIFKRNEDGSFEVVYDNIGDQALLPGATRQGFAEGGLVAEISNNAMADYFKAASGMMSEVEFTGKHKMSTKAFEDKFEEENNVDISGAESFKEITGTSKGDNMPKQMSFFNEGGIAAPRRDPVSGNEIPLGSSAENVRDDVPAMLSEGEYVVPADVVRFFGVNFFEQLRDKAKGGMQEMVADDRVGGNNPQQENMQVDPEMAQAVTQMAEGGLIDSGNINQLIDKVVQSAKTNPELQGIFQQRGITMAEGGLVAGNQPQGTFNAADWQNVGGSYGVGSDGGFEYVPYTGPNGSTMMVLHINGQPAQTIPEGFSSGKASAGINPNAGSGSYSAPTPQGNDRDQSMNAAQRYAQEGPGGQGVPMGEAGSSLANFNSPLEGLDFTDSESVVEHFSGRLAPDALKAKLSPNLGLSMVSGAVNMGREARRVAETRAAAMAAEAAGNEELAANLREMAQTAHDEYGLGGVMGLIPDEMMDGDRIYEGYVQKQQRLAEEGGIAGRSAATGTGSMQSVSRDTPAGARPISGGVVSATPLVRNNDGDGHRTVTDVGGVTYRQTSNSDDPNTYSSRTAVGSTAPTTSARPGQARPMYKGGLVTRPNKK